MILKKCCKKVLRQTGLGTTKSCNICGKLLLPLTKDGIVSIDRRNQYKILYGGILEKVWSISDGVKTR